MLLKTPFVLRFVAALVTLSVANLLSAQLSFTTVFSGGDTTQQNATTAALNSLAGYFSNNITLKVSVTIGDLNNADTLGSSSASFSQDGTYFYTTPLYNVRTSTDLSGSATSVTINMNTNAGITWGYSAGAPGTAAYSWQTVIMHEVIHSMGFYDGIADQTGALAEADYTIFDSFAKNNTGNVAFTSYTTDGERATAITGNNLV